METSKLEKRNSPQKNAAVDVTPHWQQVRAVTISVAQTLALQLSASFSSSFAGDFTCVIPKERFSGAIEMASA
jgi:hypothetical protein